MPVYLRLFGESASDDAPVRRVPCDGVERTWRLRLSDGRIVSWAGCCAGSTIEHYKTVHPDDFVVDAEPDDNLIVGFRPDMIIEPGHPLWGKRVVVECSKRNR